MIYNKNIHTRNASFICLCIMNLLKIIFEKFINYQSIQESVSWCSKFSEELEEIIRVLINNFFFLRKFVKNGDWQKVKKKPIYADWHVEDNENTLTWTQFFQLKFKKTQNEQESFY